MRKGKNININKRPVVMICECDPDLLSLFKQTLGSKFTMILVKSGRDCLVRYIDEKAKGTQIDILFVDYHLHDLHGDTVATTIGELSGGRKRSLNMILICERGVDKELIEDLRGRNCIVESLEKPVSANSLLEVLGRVSTPSS